MICWLDQTPSLPGTGSTSLCLHEVLLYVQMCSSVLTGRGQGWKCDIIRQVLELGNFEWNPFLFSLAFRAMSKQIQHFIEKKFNKKWKLFLFWTLHYLLGVKTLQTTYKYGLENSVRIGSRGSCKCPQFLCCIPWSASVVSHVRGVGILWAAFQLLRLSGWLWQTRPSEMHCTDMTFLALTKIVTLELWKLWVNEVELPRDLGTSKSPYAKIKGKLLAIQSPKVKA